MSRQTGMGDALVRARRRLTVVSAPETAQGQRVAFVVLLAVIALALLINVAASAVVVPVLALVVPVVFGGFLLPPELLVAELTSTIVAMIVEATSVVPGAVRPASYVVLVIVAVIALQQSVDRERLGLSAGRGEAMLLELRDRLQLQSKLPPLPTGWHAETQQESAGGASFGGDFFVAARTDNEKMLELVLVDVSGKGIEAGSRALLVSGALGGLLGSVPPQRFLAAANDYLCRQRWVDGFATALHVAIDLTSGMYRVTSAGHPPAVHYAGGSGRWELIEPDGVVLGVEPDARFGVAEGELRPYDALLLYTDGLVETPGRDLALGIDRLLGAAERLIPRGFDGGAKRLFDDVSPEGRDDRALLLLWRT
ncbi:MAG TPA: PP2C family protein-serine/threonine phosphatase [Mycobacteriales bacterium]|nr:PP2C family protein-serine/threonine phosphatase [Mycobacteriales bacterium]